MLKPRLIVLRGSVSNGRRYLYNEHLLFNGTYVYGGVGVTIEADNESKIKLELRRSESQDTGETYETVTVLRGEPIGLLLALTYDQNYEYVRHVAGTGQINELDLGPKLEFSY